MNSRFSNLFHDFVVKCKYNPIGDLVDVVFTPFAIVKSITYEDAFLCFNLFYKNTVYGDAILKKFLDGEYSVSAMERDHNLCRAMFRAVIYRLSDYIGRNFQEYVKYVLKIELEYDWDIMEDNFDSLFVETQKLFYEQYDEDELRNLICQYRQDLRIPPLKKTVYLKKEKLRGTQGRTNNYIRKRTSEKRSKQILS